MVFKKVLLFFRSFSFDEIVGGFAHRSRFARDHLRGGDESLTELARLVFRHSCNLQSPFKHKFFLSGRSFLDEQFRRQRDRLCRVENLLVEIQIFVRLKKTVRNWFNPRGKSDQLVVLFNFSKKSWAKRSKKREAKFRVKISRFFYRLRINNEPVMTICVGVKNQNLRYFNAKLRFAHLFLAELKRTTNWQL